MAGSSQEHPDAQSACELGPKSTCNVSEAEASCSHQADTTKQVLVMPAHRQLHPKRDSTEKAKTSATEPSASGCLQAQASWHVAQVTAQQEACTTGLQMSRTTQPAVNERPACLMHKRDHITALQQKQPLILPALTAAPAPAQVAHFCSGCVTG